VDQFQARIRPEYSTPSEEVVRSAPRKGDLRLTYAHTKEALRIQHPERRPIMALLLELVTGRYRHRSLSIDQPEVEQCVVP
jgi:hypothetical protein